MDREAKRTHTQKLILETTKELVSEKGCSNMTLNDIMERTGLSKGAIYHYVKSKDELFVLILLERLELINSRFYAQVDKGAQELEGPLNEIIKSLPSLQNPNEVTNRILIYLLGQNDVPAISSVLHQFYEQTARLSKQWIESGQRAGAISKNIDAAKTSELFVLLSYGMRMRSALSSQLHAFTADDFSEFMMGLLKK